MYNVDGGYLTFKLYFGGFDAWELKNIENTNIVAWDSSSPARKFLSNDYKKRELTQEKLEVNNFRAEVYDTSSLPICLVPKMEADDIVACWYIFHTSEEILGIDKDYFQLPGIEYTVDHGAEKWFKQKQIEKLPKYIQELATKNFALYQMLYGDKADGIPRLLARGKRGKEQVEDCLKAIENNHLQDTLLTLFEEDIVNNAKLVLMPFYEKSNLVCPEGEFFEVWCDGEYYLPDYWTDFYEEIQENLRPKREYQMSLFDF